MNGVVAYDQALHPIGAAVLTNEAERSLPFNWEMT
jgi:hypothetical protein